MILHCPAENTVTNPVELLFSCIYFLYEINKKIVTGSKGNSMFNLARIRSFMLKLLRSLWSYTNSHQQEIWTISIQVQPKADS